MSASPGLAFGRRWSLRARLTLILAGVFVLLGGALVALTASLAHNSLVRASSSTGAAAAELKKQVAQIVNQAAPTSAKPTPTGAKPVPAQGERPTGKPVGTPPLTQTPQSKAEAARQRAAAASEAYSASAANTAVHDLVVASSLIAALLIPLAVLLAWWLAGRSLRPVRKITDAARRASANRLSERLALAGPNDEITELGDTFDAMMDRLEHAFDAQRRFIANASHELRTPLTVAGTAVDVVLAKPNRQPAQLETMARDVRAALHRAELLVDSLLALTRSQHLDHARDPVDLATITEDVLDEHRAAITERSLTVSTQLADAPATGDRVLLERLVTNLVDNAIRHNVDGGHIDLLTASRPGMVSFEITNSGRVIPADQVSRLVEPFQRVHGRANSSQSGLGLGLAIVQAVTDAHGAKLSLTAQPSGGLAVAVQLPVTGGPDQLDQRPTAQPAS